MKTINKFFLLLGTLAMTASMTGCEDTRGEHLEDFASMVYFRNGGNQTITLYRVGENAVYKVPVCKGGSDLSYTAEATVVAVEQSQLDIYNLNNGTNYIQIPSSLFKFLTDTKLSFTSEETYKEVQVELATDAISDLQEADPEHEYILALQVYSDRQVSSNINLLILKPEITIPVLSFEKSGVVDTPVKIDDVSVKAKGEVVLGMDNRWDFTCKLAIHDQEWLDAYNAENGTEFLMMPEEMYELTTSELKFTAGSNRASYEIVINRDAMDLFTEYVLPVYITECDKKEFVLSEEVLLSHAVCAPDRKEIKLTEEMLSTQYTHTGDGIGLPGLVDGVLEGTSYWHSNYSNPPAGDPVFGVYIDITLEEALTAVEFRYLTRPGNNNGVPTKIRIGASEDGETWTQILEVSEGLPTDAGAWSEFLPMAIAKKPCKYFRFGVATSKGGDCCANPPSFTALGELQLKGV